MEYTYDINEKRSGWFWHVSGLKLPFHFNKYQAKQTEKLATFLRRVREVRSQGKLPPSKLETPTDKHWESQLSGADTHKQKSPQESVLSGETGAVIDKLLEAQCGQVWEIKNKKNPGGASHYRTPILLLPGPQSEYWRKNSLMLPAGRGKMNHS